MTTKKYELTNDTINVDGMQLSRIRALRSFGIVKAGDLGGYVWREHNLSHDGIAWIFDDARVYRHARIAENARVYGDAQVYGTALVTDTAWVCRNAKIFDNACIRGNACVSDLASVFGHAVISGDAGICGCAMIFGDSHIDFRVYIGGNASISRKYHVFSAVHVGSECGQLNVYKGENGLLVHRGCFTGTVEQFLAAVKLKHHGTRFETEYIKLIEVAQSIILSGE